MSFLKALLRGMAAAQGIGGAQRTETARGPKSREWQPAPADVEATGPRSRQFRPEMGDAVVGPPVEGKQPKATPRGRAYRPDGRQEGHVLPDVLADADRRRAPDCDMPTLDAVVGMYERGAPEHEIYGAFIQLPASDQFKLIQREKQNLGDKELRQLQWLLAGYLSQAWIPLPGPQMMAAQSPANIIGYGGAAGGGKTELLLGLAGQEHTRSLILRRESVQLTAILERVQEVFNNYGGRYVGSPVPRMDWKDKNGNLTRTILFGHCQQANDWRGYAGQPRDFLGLDEATEFLEEQVHGLMAWVRTTKKGQRTRVVLATNPPRGPEGSWFFRMFEPWLSESIAQRAAPGEVRWAIKVGDEYEWLEPEFDHNGNPVEVIRDDEPYTPQSYTFIPSRLTDNPYLVESGYRRQIQSLPEPLRSQLLYGDFSAGMEDDAWQIIPSAHIDAAMARWTPRPPDGAVMTGLGVDVAQGGSDYTVLAPRYGDYFGPLQVHKGVDTNDGPAVVALIFRVLRDHARIVVDMGGGWGGSTLDHLKEHFDAVGFVPQSIATGQTSWGIGYRNLRAQAWWEFKEALDPTFGEPIALPKDEELKRELMMPRYGVEGRLLQVESKEDIRKRLGRSTDRADAIVIAWYLGHSENRGSPRAARATQRFAKTSYEGAKRRATGPSGRQRFANPRR